MRVELSADFFNELATGGLSRQTERYGRELLDEAMADVRAARCRWPSARTLLASLTTRQ